MIETEPRPLKALEDLVLSAIRGDPEATLRWVSLSQRYLLRACDDFHDQWNRTISRPIMGRSGGNGPTLEAGAQE